MKMMLHTLFLCCLLSVGTTSAKTALDEYNNYRTEEGRSAQAQLLLHLTLDDCQSFFATKDWAGFEAMIERARTQDLRNFEAWEAEGRERFGWCVGLFAKFESKDDYDAKHAKWLQLSIASGSQLAARSSQD